MDWLTDHKLPLGKWIKSGVEWLLDNATWLFDAFAESMEFVIEHFVSGMLWFHPLVMIAIFSGIAFALHRSWKLVALIVISLLLVINLGYWEETLQTLGLVLFATLVSVVVGVPLGIAAAHRPWLYSILRPILDLMQTIPTVVYLIPTMIMFGLGVVPGLISTGSAKALITHWSNSSTDNRISRRVARLGGSRSRSWLCNISAPIK